MATCILRVDELSTGPSGWGVTIFVLILTIAQLDITLEFYFILFYFIFGYISDCNLVFVLLRMTIVKVIMNACTNEVKLNYLHLILN